MTKHNIPAINWNTIEDLIDSATWKKVTEQFWLDTRVPVGNDLDDWRNQTPEMKDLFNKVFGGLTLLDTVQSEVGVIQLLPDVRTKHETAVLNNFNFMESVHAKSYSTIFSTLCTNAEIDEIFEWVRTNPQLQYKAKRVTEIYESGTPLERKVASVFLESFLFYSGFYTPLRLLGESKMVNAAEVIRLIIRDESVHGTYIGYKFKLGYDELSPEEQGKMEEWVYDLAMDLYDNECAYTDELYAEVGWTKEVKLFLEYNLNKALSNLGFSQLFPTSANDVDPIVMNGLSSTTANHDFFSQVGNGYLLGEVETISEEDFALLDLL